MITKAKNRPLMRCGGIKKFIVLPLKYLDNMSETYMEHAQLIAGAIATERHFDGKDPHPEYIVINTDEPYIQEVIDVLKKYNHWG